MNIIRINKIKDYEDKNIRIDGWVYSSRRSGKIGFLILRDGSGLIQCIIEKNHIGEEGYNSFKMLTQESSLSIHGKVVKNERARGGYEILVDSLDIHQISKEYPITPKEHGIDFLMNNRHLWLRSKKQNAILR